MHNEGVHHLSGSEELIMTRHSTRGFLLVLAALSLQLSACTDDTTGETPADASSSRPWTLLADTPGGTPLPAGAYALSAYQLTAHPPRTLAVVRAPAGYQRYEGWTFVSGDDEFSRAEPFHAMGFIATDRVVRDPCGSKRQTHDPTGYDPGGTVADLAKALASQPGAVTSEPTPVTVDGYDGLYLDYRVPDVQRCKDKAWDILPGWRLTGTGERAGIWILDVHGERVLLAWVAKRGVPREQIAEMSRMAASTHFVGR